jgi:hypothetical protein
MAQLGKTSYEAKYNDAGTGLFKTGQTRGIDSADTRALVEDLADSVPFTADDSYTWSSPQVTASGTDTYAATAAPAITAYATGQKFQIKFTNASSGVSTLNLNSVGAKKIFINPTTQATTGHIVAGQISILVYDATLDAAAGGFLMVGAPSTTSGTVTSVSGTTNRITSSGGATPVIDIDSAYDAIVAAKEVAANKGASGGYVGLSGFSIAFKNLANTFTSLFQNAATAVRTYTFQDRSGTIADDTDLAGKTDQLTTFRRLTASHTLDATDLASINAGDDLVIEMNVASANDLTVPANATQAFPVGTKITGIQYGAGQTSIVAAGGVTIHTSSGDFLARAQYAPFLLEKVATDEWYLSNGSAQAVVVSSGTWTPTLTNTTNIAASTAYACQYLRVGNTVSFSGKFSLDSTSTGDTVMGMSIPIASAFSQEFHAGGVAASYAVQQSAAIFADATNDRLTIRLTITDTTNRDWFFSGSYQII